MRGQIYGFLGPNGSGKTTTLRMVCGLLTPDGGRGTALGYDILTERDKIKRHVGYMTQRFSLYQDLSIQENLEFVARVYGLAEPEQEARGGHRAARACTGREKQLAGTLSGGWKQRLALGACILPKPDLLLLDEPTAGVDPKARREFWDEIHKLAAEGMTVLVSTHYMDEAERCHEIAYIAYGELLAQGTIAEVIEQSAPARPTRSAARTCSRWPRSSPASPASTWWRRSAPACTLPGRDAERARRGRRHFRDRPELALDPVAALAGGRVHRPDEPLAGQLPMTASTAPRELSGALTRTMAMFIKEFVQLRRDRLTFATMIFIPVVQLLLFGYAINTTPRHLPTAVLVHEESDLARSILAALGNTSYFSRHASVARSEAEMDHWIRSGEVLFGVEIPAGFERSVRRGDRPALLVVADASDPVAAGTALGALEGIVRTALARDRGLPETDRAAGRLRDPPAPPLQSRPRVTSLNIVPGLLGTILTMTMLIFTALSVTREVERGTMESLLAMPIEPLEIMLGKIAPYIVIGFIQAALIIGARRPRCSRCRSTGSMTLLARALDAVHRHQPVDRLHLLDDRAEPAAGDPDVVHVLPAQHPAVGLHVPVRGHAALGAVDRRDAAAHPLHPHRARHHAEGRHPLRPAGRGAGAARPHAARDDAGGAPLPPHAGLRCRQLHRARGTCVSGRALDLAGRERAGRGGYPCACAQRQLAQLGQLFVVLDAFRHGRHAKAGAEREDRLHDRARAVPLRRCRR